MSRLLWTSNAPWVATGYGGQTALFVPRIRALGHEVAVFGFYGVEGSVLDWNGVQTYPKHCHPFGQDIVTAHAQHFRADAILTLIDAWVMQPELYENISWVAYAPIDHEPAPPAVIDRLKHAFQPIAYSRFGEEQMRKAGLDPRYVPHAVDTTVFAPMDRGAARDKVGLPRDRFIVGMVAANKGTPSRKCFPEHIAAFAKLKRRHPDALLYLHTNIDDPPEWQTTRLTPIMEHYGLKPQIDVAWCSQYGYFCGAISPADMMALFNSFDVLMNVSRGEGFGLPILEAESCGTPVITGGWTAMPEITFAGWQVPKDEAAAEWTQQQSFMFVPRENALADRLEQAFRKSGSQSLREQARAGALAYDADHVAETYWRPVLEELTGRLGRPQVVAGPLGRAA